MFCFRLMLVLPERACGAEDYTFGYSENDGGTITLTSFTYNGTGDIYAVTIPATYDAGLQKWIRIPK